MQPILRISTCVVIVSILLPGTMSGQDEKKTTKKKIAVLENAIEKAEATVKKTEEDGKQAIKDAKTSYQKAYELYREALRKASTAERKARDEHRKAIMALHRYKRTGSTEPAKPKAPKGKKPKPKPKAKDPTLAKFEQRIQDAVTAQRTASEGWHKAVSTLNDFRRKHSRDKSPKVQSAMKKLEDEVKTAREGISTARDNWFKAVKARNAYLKSRKKK